MPACKWQTWLGDWGEGQETSQRGRAAVVHLLLAVENLCIDPFPYTLWEYVNSFIPPLVSSEEQANVQLEERQGTGGEPAEKEGAMSSKDADKEKESSLSAERACDNN